MFRLIDVLYWMTLQVFLMMFLLFQLFVGEISDLCFESNASLNLNWVLSMCSKSTMSATYYSITIKFELNAKAYKKDSTRKAKREERMKQSLFLQQIHLNILIFLYAFSLSSLFYHVLYIIHFIRYSTCDFVFSFFFSKQSLYWLIPMPNRFVHLTIHQNLLQSMLYQNVIVAITSTSIGAESQRITATEVN